MNNTFVSPVKSKRKYTKKKKNPVMKKMVILLVIALIFFVAMLQKGSITPPERVEVGQGEGLLSVVNDLSTIDQRKVKFALFQGESSEGIKVGNYQFTGSVSIGEFLGRLSSGPQQEYESFTILEGWSIYDIDYALSQKGLIDDGDYLAYVSDQNRIARLSTEHGFIDDLLLKKGTVNSLEGFLYPDTYFIDINKSVLDQLVTLQLDNFNDKVWIPLESDIKDFQQLAANRGLQLEDWESDLYGVLNLASIVEKEERISQNRPEIAGVFINRLDVNMLIGADITLCYGLEQPYELCTPAVIVRNLTDKRNLYNTRALPGLPPQPITSPTVDSVRAVVDFKQTDNFYYLHAPNGQIHFAETLQGHNINKQRYLN